MDVDPAHAALLEQFRGRLDHDRRAGEIGLAAVELVEILRDRLVHQAGAIAVAADFDEFDGCKAYLAGPPVMVEAATRLMEQRDMRRLDIHADAFYTAAEMAQAGKKTGADL